MWFKAKNTILSVRLLAVFSLLVSTNSFATSYYVSSAGNDTNSGTSITNAWATISKVNSSVFLPGDALYFEGGQTFTGNIYLSAADGNDPNNIFIISSYGTGRAIINADSANGFYAYNTQGFSVSNLIFDGNSVTTNKGAGLTIFSDLTGDVKFSNISLSNIEIKNFGLEGVTISTSNGLTGFQNVTMNSLSVHDVLKNGIKVFGYITQSLVGWQHKNVSVSNCEVYNIPGSINGPAYEGNGIVLEGVDGGVIQNSVAHDNGQNNKYCGGPAGIWTLESNNITIQYCESYKNHNGINPGCDGAGFDLDGGVTNSIMQYNYSHDNDGAGYLLGQFDQARLWSNNVMRYNISQNDGVRNEGGIGLFKGASTMMDGANIYNNTIYVSPQSGNTSESAVYLQAWNTGINHVAFYNNIFITTGGVSLVSVPVGYSAFFAGNVYWSSGEAFSISYQGQSYSTLDAWRTATSNEIVSGNHTGFSSDPLLSNVGMGGTVGFGNSLTSLNAYKINDIASPTINAGLDLNTLYAIDPGSRDFWGDLLPGAGVSDVGGNQHTIALPIKLLGFYGNCSGSSNNVFWVTAEEIDMKSFDLLYSVDGHSFSKLATVPSKGSNSGYKYVNDSISPGNNYYQLKMTDLDGVVTYSDILKVRCGTVSDKVGVGPNPFSQSINVSIESVTDGSATMTLYDALGKLISQKTALFQKGNNQVSYDGLGNLPPGTYYLQIVNQAAVQHFKLIKAGT